MEGGEVAETFATLIWPPEGHDHFSSRNTAIHGIRSTDVARTPDWPQVWKQMDYFIAGAPVVAHNAAFDRSVIRAANAATGIPWPTPRYACTVVLARQTWPDLPNYRLPRVAQAAAPRPTPSPPPRSSSPSSDSTAPAPSTASSAPPKSAGDDSTPAATRPANGEAPQQ